MNTAPTLVVAGLSARLLAEGAARDGYRVVALDAFGDLDTRRCAAHWRPIGARGAGGGPRLDPDRTVQALHAAAREPGVLGWVAGSDFECEPELLARAAGALPLIGTPPEAVRRVREPAVFFAALARHGLPHPETRLEPPADPRGWLRKCARGSGGWHIRAADEARGLDPARAPYHQRRIEGTPMSVVFAADGRAARRLGVQRLLVRPLGAHPFVYRGAVGPLALPAARLAALDGALQALAREFGLRGLCSLDFVDDGDQAWLLEVNPRPSASLALYGPGWMRAHVEAALHGRLRAVDRAGAEATAGGAGAAGGATWADLGGADRAAAVTPAPAAGTAASSEAAPHAPVRPDAVRPTVRGTEIVFARTSVAFDAARAEALAARADCHDLPAAGSRFAPGDPVCSVDAQGPDVDAVIGALAAKRGALRDAWATEDPRA